MGFLTPFFENGAKNAFFVPFSFVVEAVRWKCHPNLANDGRNMPFGTVASKTILFKYSSQPILKFLCAGPILNTLRYNEKRWFDPSYWTSFRLHIPALGKRSDAGMSKI